MQWPLEPLQPVDHRHVVAVVILLDLDVHEPIQADQAQEGEAERVDQRSGGRQDRGVLVGVVQRQAAGLDVGQAGHVGHDDQRQRETHTEDRDEHADGQKQSLLGLVQLVDDQRIDRRVVEADADFQQRQQQGCDGHVDAAEIARQYQRCG